MVRRCRASDQDALNYFAFVATHRRFLGFGVMLAGLSGFGQTFVLSLFGGEWRAAFALSNASLGMTYSLATLASGLTLIWAGRLVDTVDLRWLTGFVMLGAAVGCTLLGASTRLWMLALAFFLLRFCGQGLMVHIAQTSMARRYRERRGTAVSIATMGLPLAEASLPLLMVSVAAWLGWRQSWLAAGGVLALVMLPLVIWLLRGQETRDPLVASSRETATGTAGAAPAERHWGRREVLRDPAFYALLPAVMAPPFIVTALFFHQVVLAQEKGWTLGWLASSFVAFALAHVVSLFLAGPLVDRVTARRLVPFFLLPMILGLTALSLGQARWVAPVYLALAGFSGGMAGTIMGAIWAELYGTRHLGAIRAMVQAVMVLVSATAPVLAGVLLDAGGSMSGLAGLLAGYAGLSSLFALWMRPTPRVAGSA